MIETERLFLRPYVRGDYEPYFAMTAEPAVLHWSAGPLTRQQAWQRLIRLAGHQSLFGYGIFAVLDKVTGEYLGETGIGQFYREVHSDFDGVDEASWTFVGRCHGGGFALEAASPAHSWYYKEIGNARTVCMITPTNIPSLRLAEKLGYRLFARAAFNDTDMMLFERCRARGSS